MSHVSHGVREREIYYLYIYIYTYFVTFDTLRWLKMRTSAVFNDVTFLTYDLRHMAPIFVTCVTSYIIANAI